MRTVIPATLAGERVDKVIALLTGRPRAEVAGMVKSGQVQVDGNVVKASTRVEEGDELAFAIEALAPPEVMEGDASVAVPVVHVDDDIIVVDKPADLVVHPGAGRRRGTLAQGLLAQFPELLQVGSPERPGIVHRLDKGTSGLMVVARNPLAYENLVAQMAQRQVERRYLALVLGHPHPERGLIDAPVGRSRRSPTRMAVSVKGREARTGYEVRQAFDHPYLAALLECRLETGRTHQVRVHLASIGHPIVGDSRYGRRAVPLDHRVAVPGRQFLHAAHLALDHPGDGRRVSFESALPSDLEDVLAHLS